MFGVNKPQVISISHKFRTLLFLYFIRGGKVNLRIYEEFCNRKSTIIAISLARRKLYFHPSQRLLSCQ